MGYRVSYGRTIEKSTLSNKNPKHAIIFITALITVICICWIGGGSEDIRSWLMPGDPEITEAALSGLMRDLKEGHSVSDAITVFCREIITNGTE